VAVSDKPASPSPEYNAPRITELWRGLTTPVRWLLRYADVPTCLVAELPTAASAGAGVRGFVTDSNATLAAGHGNTVAGAGANKVPVYSDGTAWRIG
jgi:hypothetical protein